MFCITLYNTTLSFFQMTGATVAAIVFVSLVLAPLAVNPSAAPLGPTVMFTSIMKSISLYHIFYDSYNSAVMLYVMKLWIEAFCGFLYLVRNTKQFLNS